jgi:hypothetical protein
MYAVEAADPDFKDGVGGIVLIVRKWREEALGACLVAKTMITY